MSGADLVREAGGGIVAVELEYRLGIFGRQTQSHHSVSFRFECFNVSVSIGFLPGKEVKKKGALNAGLREFIVLLD